MTVIHAPRSLSFIAAGMLLSGCAFNDGGSAKFRQSTATLANGSTVPTNVFSQINSGLGSKLQCVAQGQDVNTKAIVMSGCISTTGPMRGGVDSTAEIAGAAGSLTYGIGAIKAAFSPASSAASGSTTMVQETKTGALTVVTRPGGPTNQTNIAKTGAITNSNVVIGQGNLAAVPGF